MKNSLKLVIFVAFEECEKKNAVLFQLFWLLFKVEITDTA